MCSLKESITFTIAPIDIVFENHSIFIEFVGTKALADSYSVIFLSLAISISFYVMHWQNFHKFNECKYKRAVCYLSFDS